MAEKNVDVFNPESMVEVFPVGGQELRLYPLKVKTFRQVVSLIDASLGSLTKLDAQTTVRQVTDLVFEKYVEVLLLLFPVEKFEYMTKEFVEENFTLPIARRIMEVVVEQNGLGQLFPFLKKLTPGEAPSKTTTGA